MERRTFRTLDLLRGVAALVVLAFHIVSTGWPGTPFLGGAYLAVDLFFMLSGFVIAHAYEERLRTRIGFGRFVEIRLIRLYPLYILGCAIGLVWPLGQALVTHQHWLAHDPLKRLPFALAMLPYPTWDSGKWFVLDPPGWSLFYEMAVNILYALALRWLTTSRLIAITALSGLAILGQSIAHGTLNFSVVGPAEIGSFARPLFAFPAGVLLYRGWKAGRLPRIAIPPIGCVALFLLLLAVPSTGPVAGVLAPLAVIVGFPLLIVAAAATDPSGAAAGAARSLGALSYPLYAIHFPLLSLLRAIGAHFDLLPIATDLAAVPIIIAAAWAALVFYDEPVRIRLARLAAARQRDVEAAPPL